MANKEVKSVRKTPLGDEHVPMSEWLAAVERKADNIMTGTKVVQLSQLLDTPDFCQQFIDLARKTLECRDMQIRARVQLWNDDGTPVLTKKRKHKVEWQQLQLPRVQRRGAADQSPRLYRREPGGQHGLPWRAVGDVHARRDQAAHGLRHSRVAPWVGAFSRREHRAQPRYHPRHARRRRRGAPRARLRLQVPRNSVHLLLRTE
ncbi:hypothetical protein G6F24_014755 [Rhizopus arrhizus]|nr:hypothetical protein G6F24_014755 [Rhizopus arrhizus]